MRTTRPALAAALFAAAAIGPGASAQAPRPAPAPAAAQTDAAYEAARLAFEALPEAERKAIQEALVWTGDHNGVTSGGFGRRTFEAIVAYQKRGGLKPDGTLDVKERAALQTAAKKLKDDAKFAVVADAKTGIAIGVPQAVLPKRDVNPNGGSRWQSPDGKITLDTRAFKDGETDFPRSTSATSRSSRRGARSPTRSCGRTSSSSRARPRPASSTPATPAVPAASAASRSATTRRPRRRSIAP